jgi:hypothetical protein
VKNHQVHWRMHFYWPWSSNICILNTSDGTHTAAHLIKSAFKAGIQYKSLIILLYETPTYIIWYIFNKIPK